MQVIDPAFLEIIEFILDAFDRLIETVDIHQSAKHIAFLVPVIGLCTLFIPCLEFFVTFFKHVFEHFNESVV